jgi:hypothetical protein
VSASDEPRKEFGPFPTPEMFAATNEIPHDLTCPCGNALVRDGAVVKSHWPGTICEDCEALIFQRHNAPKCWRCKARPGLVSDGTVHECIECAGRTMQRARTLLNEIDDAVKEGLNVWPRISDRVEFVRVCVQMHREQAVRLKAGA